MNDEMEFKPVESPCVGQCCLNEQDICLGCYRSLDEITSWALVDEETRQLYRRNIAERKSKV